MNIELRHLNWAIVASRHRSIRRAAETLNIRQSTLSRCLRDLEYEIGAALFDRTNGGTQPTPIGREFLGTAQRLLEEADSAFSRLKTRRRGENGELRIGVHGSLSAGNLRATLVEHRLRFEGVELRFIDGVRDRLLGDLLANALDVAIVTAVHPPQWSDRVLPLWSERVIVALPEQHALREHAALEWRQIKKERILLTQRGVDPDIEQLIHAKNQGPGLQIVHQEVSLDRILSLVGAGFGVSPMLEGATGASYGGVVYRELHEDGGPIRLHFSAYWREGNGNPALTPFLDLLRDRYPDLSVSGASG